MGLKYQRSPPNAYLVLASYGIKTQIKTTFAHVTLEINLNFIR